MPYRPPFPQLAEDASSRRPSPNCQPPANWPAAPRILAVLGLYTPMLRAL